MREEISSRQGLVLIIIFILNDQSCCQEKRLYKQRHFDMKIMISGSVALYCGGFAVNF